MEYNSYSIYSFYNLHLFLYFVEKKIDLIRFKIIEKGRNFIKDFFLLQKFDRKLVFYKNVLMKFLINFSKFVWNGMDNFIN